MKLRCTVCKGYLLTVVLRNIVGYCANRIAVCMFLMARTARQNSQQLQKKCILIQLICSTLHIVYAAKLMKNAFELYTICNFCIGRTIMWKFSQRFLYCGSSKMQPVGNRFSL